MNKIKLVNVEEVVAILLEELEKSSDPDEVEVSVDEMLRRIGKLQKWDVTVMEETE